VHVPRASHYYQAQESDPFIHRMIDINYRNTIGDLSDPQLDSRWRDTTPSTSRRVKRNRVGDALKGKSLSLSLSFSLCSRPFPPPGRRSSPQGELECSTGRPRNLVEDVRRGESERERERERGEARETGRDGESTYTQNGVSYPVGRRGW